MTIEKAVPNLTRCPFCGSMPVVQIDTCYPRCGKYEDKAVRTFEIICTTMSCIIYRADGRYFYTIEEAVKAWNTRASGWFPVSESIPVNKGTYLVACYRWDLFEDKFDDNISFLVLDYLPDAGHWNIKTPLKVLAWMPLPEPPERK